MKLYVIMLSLQNFKLNEQIVIFLFSFSVKLLSNSDQFLNLANSYKPQIIPESTLSVCSPLLKAVNPVIFFFRRVKQDYCCNVAAS